MPRPKTLSDRDVLATALRLMHEQGPRGVDLRRAVRVVRALGRHARPAFRDQDRAPAGHLAPRLGSPGREDGGARAQKAPRTPAGAVRLLVGLSQDYGGIEAYAEGLLVLREDLRDPALRARGAAWRDVLAAALDQCFAGVPQAPTGIGLMLAAQWQGSLLWWGFDPRGPLERYVERSLKRFVTAIVPRKGSPRP